MLGRLLAAAALLGALAATAHAEDMSLPKTKLTITVPDADGWQLAGGGAGYDVLTRPYGADQLQVNVAVLDVDCALAREHASQADPSLARDAAPSGIPATWSADALWYRATGDEAVDLCFDLGPDDVGVMVVLAAAAVDDDAVAAALPLLRAVERSARRTRGQIGSGEPVPVDPFSVSIYPVGTDAYWLSAADPDHPGDWLILRAAPTSKYYVSVLGAGTASCDDYTEFGVKTGRVVYDDALPTYQVLGRGMRFTAKSGGAGITYCGAGRPVTFDERAPDTDAIMMALEIALGGTVITSAPTTSDTSYGGATNPYSDPYGGGYGGYGGYGGGSEPSSGGGHAWRAKSSTRDFDVRAGISSVSPHLGESAGGFAAGVDVPLRMIGRHLGFEARAMLAHAGDLGNALDAHAGAALATTILDGALTLGWTAGLGYDSWFTGDPGLDGGVHVYTGPVVRVGGRVVALEAETAFVIQGGLDASRVRADLAYAGWTHKLALGVERTSWSDHSASATTLTLAVGLGSL